LIHLNITPVEFTKVVPITIACIGLAQMVLQVVVLFGFQVLHGVVVAEVSLIVTAFIAGLALGGTASSRWLSTIARSSSVTMPAEPPGCCTVLTCWEAALLTFLGRSFQVLRLFETTV
jgi:hypothetical protein